MNVELCTLYCICVTLQEKVWIEIFVVERYRLERLDSPPGPGPVPLVVRHVQGPQAVVGDPGEDTLQVTG